MRKTVRILFPCIGRRVVLAKAFADAAAELGLRGILIGTDASASAPAMQVCDRQYVVPLVKHPRYGTVTRRIVRDEKIDLVVPTIDLDLRYWAGVRDTLARQNCTVLVSAPEVVAISQDKRKMYRLLTRNGFDTPETTSVAATLKRERHHFPYFLKPWDGHASRGNAVVRNKDELRFFSRRVPNCIVQEFVEGAEHTVDALVDFDMQVRCIIPRLRLEARAGEVSKGQTVKHPGIMAEARRLVETLQAGPGIVTIQCFLTPGGKIKIIEVNPRFGGGIPLSIRAGARIPRWILQWWAGQNPRIRSDGWRDGLLMLRYDEAIWINNHVSSDIR